MLYVRVSDQRQAEKDLSIPAQLTALRKYAKDHGYVIVQEFLEPGVSGTDDNRPAFRRMMADILAPSSEVDAILCAYTSRFMRNAAKARVWKDRLRKKGVHVIATNQETTDDPTGRLLEGLLESFDQFESEMNGLRTSAAIRENARRGFVNTTKAPLGFRVEKVSVGNNVRHKLVPCAEEVPVVKACLRAYVMQGGALAAAKALHDNGLSHRGKPWTKDRVLATVSEHALVGTYYWGRRDSRTGEERARDEWIAIECEPIVDRDLFETAQRVRADRDPVRNPGRTPSSPLLLAGIMACGKCGAPYQLETSQKTSSSGVFEYRYANCRAHRRTGAHACAGFRVRLDLLEDAVRQHVAERLFTRERCEAIIRDAVEGHGHLREKTSEHRREQQRQLGEVERAMTRYALAFESGALDASVLSDRVRELTAKRDEIRSTLAKVVPIHQLPPHLYSAKTIDRFREGLRALFLSGDPSFAKAYLRTLLERVVIREECLQLIAMPGAVVEAMVAGGKVPTPEAASGHSRTPVGSGLRLLDSNQRPGG